MGYGFKHMNEECAKTIKKWRYGGEYSIYDYENDTNILNAENWKYMFAVFDGDGQLVGETTFYNNDYEYDCDNPFTDMDMFYGQGMKPELTGKGAGPGFINAAFDFGIKKFDYKREYVYLDVLTFNKRAYRAYEKAGFEFFKEYSLEYEGKLYEFIRMRRKNPCFEENMK